MEENFKKSNLFLDSAYISLFFNVTAMFIETRIMSYNGILYILFNETCRLFRRPRAQGCFRNLLIVKVLAAEMMLEIAEIVKITGRKI